LFSVRRLLGTIGSTSILSAAALVALPVAAGQARPPAPTPCAVDNSGLSQAFLAWGDSATYSMVPGGDGSLTGWSLAGGAGQVDGGNGGGSALGLPSGAVATAPGACVNIPHATARFFIRTDTPGTTVKVAAVYSHGAATVAVPAGTVTPTSSWAPSPSLKIRPVVVAAMFGGTAYETLRFTASGGTAQIDDVYVDPWSRG
jgi:hypothetical protein